MKFLLALALVCMPFVCRGSTEAQPTPPPRAENLTFPVNRDKVDVHNGFSSRNPYYKQSAGAFYDTEYVSFSVRHLFKLADIEPDQMTGTLDILRGFVYDWLDFYVRGDGKISNKERLKCVEAMNAKFKQLLTPIQYKIYEIWRDDTSGQNTLHFLLVPAADKAQQDAAANP